MKDKVGFLGMGKMGAPMAKNLLKAGYRVVVYNRNRAKAEALAADGAEVAGSPAEVAARAPVILSCLGDAEAVQQVVSGPGGILEAVRPGQVFVDMSTNSPPVVVKLAQLLSAKGAAMLDAPVSGGDVGAIEGTLSIMVGGDPGTFERVLPFFKVLGRKITLMGPNVGAGSYAKLANQIMVGIHLAAMGEAFVFAAKAGLELPLLVEALGGGMANSAAMALKSPKVLSGDFTPGGTAQVQLKDLNYIQQAMEKLGIDLPVTGLVRTLYQQLVAQGHGGEDHSSIVRIFEQGAGVEARA